MLKNRIGLLISWPREIDIFSKFFEAKSQKIDFIVNDNFSFEKGRNFSNKKIVEILKEKKIIFRYFSEIYKKEKYKVIISTGEFSGYHISVYSIFRFIYGRTIGSIIEYFGLSLYFFKKFGRSFTADGNNSKIGISSFPEKKIGKIVVKFPDGIDIKKKNYPYDFYKNIFDIFFSYCDFEIDLIQKKFNNKILKKIDYFRYDYVQHYKGNFNKLDHKIDKAKKTIYWLPTHIDNGKDEDKNLSNWIYKLNFLNKHFNIILRPHPKTISRNKDLIHEISKLDYILDTDFNKKIGEAIINSDLIFADYGGIVFDTLYLEKKIILLDLDSKTNFVKTLKDIESVDIDIRNHLKSLKDEDTEKNIMSKLRIVIDENLERVKTLKNHYFGKKNYLNFEQTLGYLQDLL